MSLTCCGQPGFALGTVAGTDIANTVQVDYLIAGTPQTTYSNTVTITGAGVLDVDVTSATETRGALANNGGFARTHAILPGSQAIDSGTGTVCPVTYQRGTARPQDGDSNGSFICDMAAYEALGGPVTGTDLAVAMTNDQDPVTFNALFSYMITIANNGPDDATGVVLTDNLPALATYQSATASQGSCVHAGGSPGGALTCALGSIAHGASAIVELIVKDTLNANLAFLAGD